MILVEDSLCTGCAACANACPEEAITMVDDVEGFPQPKIDDDRCVECGRCRASCPLINFGRNRPTQVEVKLPLCGCTSDYTVWKSSSSGGAFSELCMAVASCNNKSVFFGARFATVGKVVTDSVDNVEDVRMFRKSKYVQSYIGMSFSQCRRYLADGRYVVFSGTPCQIAGLLTYLGRGYKNLLTVEFVCHGVGSAKFFNSCLRHASEDFGSRVVGYTFRSKEHLGVDDYTSTYKLEDGRCVHVKYDVYNRFFLRQFCLRKSCMENCLFRSSDRYADITLADCRMVEKIYPDKDFRNWSVVVANTEKGESIVLKLTSRMNLRRYPIDLFKQTNPLYFMNMPGNPKRGKFFEC